MVTGYVEGFEGSYLCGWALADKTCDIKIINDAGRVLKTGRASRNRVVLGLNGFHNVGFRIPLGHPRSRKPQRLHVTADNVELPGSPLEIGKGVHDGAIWIHGGTLSGWVSERVADFSPPSIRIIDHYGQEIAELQSALHVQDDPLFAAAHFSHELPDSCFGAGEICLTAFANGIKFAQTTGALLIDGHLDVISPTRCAGWLFCPAAPERKPRVEIYRDGVRVGSTIPNVLRDDVGEKYPDLPGASSCGFDVKLDPPDDIDRLFSLSVRLAGSEDVLFGGPFVVGNRPSVIRAARRLATTVYKEEGLESGILQLAMADFIRHSRSIDDFQVARCATAAENSSAPRLSIIIPIYRGVEITETCIKSVLANRCAGTDNVVLINDHSPEPAMSGMLQQFSSEPRVYHLTNYTNLGFIKSVNRGLALCRRGDVILLNSDTRIFKGAFDELHRVAYKEADIGTVTALSNNATIFSYPDPKHPIERLDDVSWEELAAQALLSNGGISYDVPTAHGFCMYVKRDLLHRVGFLDEKYGRGYGEENDFCQRATDLGFRHVAAAGVFVEHRESVSFGEDKERLRRTNVALVGKDYPDYTPNIMRWEKIDDLRQARWPLDKFRLKKLGCAFAVVITNDLNGGTRRAISDIEAAEGYGNAKKLLLQCREDGYVSLIVADASVNALFALDEIESLFGVLDSLEISSIMIHQLLGFTEPFVRRLTEWMSGKKTSFYVHDFYTICPRVTMIDALGEFCDAAKAERCVGCLDIGKPHVYAKMNLEPGVHREMMGQLLHKCYELVAPSRNAASYIERLFPHLEIAIRPHPDRFELPRVGSGDKRSIVLLGAIGPDKGSARLLELAKLARLDHPDLRFTVIGHTDIDDELLLVGNVSITGPYEPEDLADLVAKTHAGFALFLHKWPETFSYTFSEAVKLGLTPIIPDIGAPIERAGSLGIVFPFKSDSRNILRTIKASK